MTRALGQVVSVNVGLAREVEWRGRRFSTAISKTSVPGPIPVRGVNLAGDDQADRTVHGGPDKAVYAYSAEDYAWWENELGRTFLPGTFGDNLTTLDVDLGAVSIGERWRVGTALLEVASPRVPCYKLAYVLDDEKFVKRFARELRLGAYFRIIEEGTIEAGAALTLIARPQPAPTLRDIGTIVFFERSRASELLEVPALGADFVAWAREHT